MCLKDSLVLIRVVSSISMINDTYKRPWQDLSYDRYWRHYYALWPILGGF